MLNRLDLEAFERQAPATASKDRKPDPNFSAVLASSYLKYCQVLASDRQNESSDQLVALYQLHQQLQVQIKRFLKGRLPVVRQDEPVADVLLQFARWRGEHAQELGLDQAQVQAEQTAVEALKQPVGV